MYDARVIANSILDLTTERGISCSNLKLQKLLYFVHGQWLTRFGKPLIQGEFEAWPHGPVHPLVYQTFKGFGASDITSRAKSLNPITREKVDLLPPTDIQVIDIITKVVTGLGHLSGSQLRNITHSKGSPWNVVVDSSEHIANIGMKMPNSVIKENFGKQLYLVGGGPEESDLDEDAPYSRD